MSLDIFIEKVNGKTAGRDLLVYNIKDYPQYREVVKGMLQDIRNDELDDNLELFKDMENQFEDKLFNTEYHSLGHTVFEYEGYFMVAVGVSPHYQWEKLVIIVIEKDINKSRLITGESFGPYGSGIRSSEKSYSKMKKGKYKEYIEKWHKELCLVNNQEEK